MADVYDIGDQARLKGIFTDPHNDDGLFDPTKVRIETKDPGGTVSTKVWPTDAEVVKDGVGQFHRDVKLTIAGDWHYRIEGEDASANLIVAEEGKFNVRKQNV